MRLEERSDQVRYVTIGFIGLFFSLFAVPVQAQAIPFICGQDMEPKVRNAILTHGFIPVFEHFIDLDLIAQRAIGKERLTKPQRERLRKAAEETVRKVLTDKLSLVRIDSTRSRVRVDSRVTRIRIHYQNFGDDRPREVSLLAVTNGCRVFDLEFRGGFPLSKQVFRAYLRS